VRICPRAKNPTQETNLEALIPLEPLTKKGGQDSEPSKQHELKIALVLGQNYDVLF
jgi:hypothetical protein